MDKRIEGIKKMMETGEKAIQESGSWTENQAGGWEILAKGYKNVAEKLLELVEEMSKANSEQQIDLILNRAEAKRRTHYGEEEWRKAHGKPSDKECSAFERGELTGLLEAARLLTIEVDDPVDNAYRSDYFGWGADGICRNGKIVRKAGDRL